PRAEQQALRHDDQFERLLARRRILEQEVARLMELLDPAQGALEQQHVASRKNHALAPGEDMRAAPDHAMAMQAGEPLELGQVQSGILRGIWKASLGKEMRRTCVGRGDIARREAREYARRADHQPSDAR